MVVVLGDDIRGYYVVTDEVKLVDKHLDCKVENFPVKVSNAKGVNGTICGGFTGDLNNLYSADCYILEPNGTWSKGHSMHEAKQGFSLTLVKNSLLSIGGMLPGVLDTVEKYDLVRREGWEKLERAPRKIANHCAVLLNSSLFVLGGRQSLDTYHTGHRVIFVYFDP